jgi:zinc transport system permease protein
MLEFIVNAALAGLGIAILAGPLGSFMVWRRMAYFGDTLAHSALLGVTLGLLLSVDIFFAVTLCCLIIAVLLFLMQSNHTLPTDTILGILSHGSLALGLVLISLLDGPQINLMDYLFGDLLTVSLSDIAWIYTIVITCSALIFLNWKALLATTVHEELAQVEGIPVRSLRLMLLLITALVIAIGMKVAGVLLVTALLIIPAAAAGKLAKTPAQMAVIASLLGAVSVCLGLAASYFWDTPTGPSIVASSAVLFFSLSTVSTWLKG